MRTSYLLRNKVTRTLTDYDHFLGARKYANRLVDPEEVSAMVLALRGDGITWGAPQ